MINLIRLLTTVLAMQFPSWPSARGALCHRQASTLETTLRGIQTFVMRHDHRNKEECATQHFQGGAYGVTATVALNMRTRSAFVELRGLVIGGSLSGVGWLENADAEEGGVVLEEEFEEKLAWCIPFSPTPTSTPTPTLTML